MNPVALVLLSSFRWPRYPKRSSQLSQTLPSCARLTKSHTNPMTSPINHKRKTKQIEKKKQTRMRRSKRLLTKTLLQRKKRFKLLSRTKIPQRRSLKNLNPKVRM